jgi:hypothetical protein
MKNMNKARVLGLILFLIGFFLMYKNNNSGNGWMVSAMIGAGTAAGFFLTVFGTFNFKIKV